MKYKALLGFIAVLALESSALAGPQDSTLGGKKIATGNHVHQVGVGWPSLFYTWWNGAAKMDWGLGGEFVYAEWNGLNDTGGDLLGIAFNAPLRWHIHDRQHENAKTDVGILLKPGVFIGGNTNADLFVFGIRPELGIPVSIDVHERVNVITGGSIPFTIYFVEDNDASFDIPLLFRMGVEVAANETIAPWFLAEVGPDILTGNGNTDVEVAFRIWVGCNFGPGAGSHAGGPNKGTNDDFDDEPETL